MSTSGLKTYELISIKNKKTGGEMKIAINDYNPEEHELFDGKVEITPASPTSTPATSIDFSKMTLDELKNFALQYAIDITGAKSKADVSKKIEAWKEANTPKE